MHNKLILASSSIYRCKLLRRLQVPFESIAPQLDESVLENEIPRAAAVRLARQKAQKIARSVTGSTIIGSDQLAEFAGQTLTKAGSAPAQVKQLQGLSGAEATFFTAVCVLHQPSGAIREAVIPVAVKFRTLSSQTIQRYVEAEPAWDCAGGFKIEGLGIGLFDYVRGDDPTALEGLPLIQVATFLREFGYRVP